MNYFSKDFAWSNSEAVRLFWQGIYKAAFGALDTIELVVDKQEQKKGVDVIVYLPDGQAIKVEEKIRRKNWDDIVLEVWSDKKRKIPGWAVKEQEANILAYGFFQGKYAHLFERQKLRTVFIENGRTWAKEFGTITAHNQGYDTVSIPVPIRVLQETMGKSMKQFKAHKEEAP